MGITTNPGQEPDTENIEDTKEKKKKGILKWTIAIIIIIILILLLRSCGHTNHNVITQGDIASTSRKTSEELDQIAQEGMFTTFLNKNIAIDKNNVANILVKNDKNNKYNAVVEYYLDDELVYETEEISPGYKQEQAKMEYNFTKGTHELKAVFCIVDESGKELNKVTIPVMVTK